jgi:hypothetical protein
MLYFSYRIIVKTQLYHEKRLVWSKKDQVLLCLCTTKILGFLNRMLYFSYRIIVKTHLHNYTIRKGQYAVKKTKF